MLATKTEELGILFNNLFVFQGGREAVSSWKRRVIGGGGSEARQGTRIGTESAGATRERTSHARTARLLRVF